MGAKHVQWYSLSGTPNLPSFPFVFCSPVFARLHRCCCFSEQALCSRRGPRHVFSMPTTWRHCTQTTASSLEEPPLRVVFDQIQNVLRKILRLLREAGPSSLGRTHFASSGYPTLIALTAAEIRKVQKYKHRYMVCQPWVPSCLFCHQIVPNICPGFTTSYSPCRQLRSRYLVRAR